MGWKNISHYFIFRELKINPYLEPSLGNLNINNG